MTRTLVEMGVPFVYYRVDQMAEGAQVGRLALLRRPAALLESRRRLADY